MAPSSSSSASASLSAATATPAAAVSLNVSHHHPRPRAHPQHQLQPPPLTSTARAVVSLFHPRLSTAPGFVNPSHPSEALTLTHRDLPTTTISPYLSTPTHPPPPSRSRSHAVPDHRRSNSSNSLRDATQPVQRWSQSTTSSKSSSEHKRSRSFSQRLSIVGASLSASASASASSSTSAHSYAAAPLRPRKTRHAARSKSPVLPTATLARSSIAPPELLPPIVALPTLQLAVDEGTAAIAADRDTDASPFRSATTQDAAGTRTTRSRLDDYLPPPAHATGASNTTTDTNKSTSVAATGRDAVSDGGGPDRGGGGGGGGGGDRSLDPRPRRPSSTVAASNSPRKPSSQKAMLSKALQKANTAVLLDNAQNFEGAIHAYGEACDLLEHVMSRSSGHDDKRKLEAIHNTYRSRISELQKLGPLSHAADQKALPARPPSRDDDADDVDDDDRLVSPIFEYEDTPAIIETATVTRIIQEPDPAATESMRHRESRVMDGSRLYLNTGSDYFQQRSFATSPLRDRLIETRMNLAPMDEDYMPPPLSPRRPATPQRDDDWRADVSRQLAQSLQSAQSLSPPPKVHNRTPSNESMSWLDTIDESSVSDASSVHSHTSSLRIRRRPLQHARASSGATEAEFDAALDAAVEAAYDDGYELDAAAADPPYDNDEIIANVRRRVDLRKEREREESQREAAIRYSLNRERQRLILSEREDHVLPEEDDPAGTESDEEEERMLEEMTRGYVLDGFEFGLQSKFSVPRESDSSGFSGRTWNSSIVSNPTTSGTTLSTVAEDIAPLPAMSSRLSPPLAGPPPAHAAPAPPEGPIPPLPATETTPESSSASQSVRDRRLSGLHAKQLKIETSALAPLTTYDLTSPTHSQPIAIKPPPAQTSLSTTRISSRQTSSPFPGPSPLDNLPPFTPTVPRATDADGDTTSRAGSPARAQSRTALRKNQSSSSLKNMRSRNLSLSAADEASDMSPLTPLSTSYSTSARDYIGRLPAIPALPSPIATAFRDKMGGGVTPGFALFDTDLQFPESPTSERVADDAVLQVEPCPTENLRRPYWLMRALYQTIAHPRGGFLSTRLFIPNDVWRVKGVKLKNIEDKIANCDFLTAALLNLAKVDTCDADAVLDEMQAIEAVLEQAQQALAKKLGNEVGVQASGVLFKDAPTPDDDNMPRSASTTAKGAFSWRRLRSKNSAGAFTGSSTLKTTSEVPRDGVTLKSVPMASQSFGKPPRRDLSLVQFTGPNATYMSALARLFDAVQVIDQIARQVEDPGLRHADKTQVGLELSVRHASEFFGFYVCRFVLTDVGMLLDKYLKRGSEWVTV